MKIDLIKAYDSVDWGYLVIVLHKINLSVMVVDWIVAHVSSTNFVILINGVPSRFFKATRGFKAGMLSNTFTISIGD